MVGVVERIQNGRQDFEPDLFVRYMPVGGTAVSGGANEADMGIATVEGATHPTRSLFVEIRPT